MTAAPLIPSDILEPFMHDGRLEDAVKEGQKQDSRLWMSIEELDQHLEEHHELFNTDTAQVSAHEGLAPLHEWTDSMVKDRYSNTMSPIIPGLSNLNVGTQDGTTPWYASRSVNVRQWPDGFNICLRMIQDLIYKEGYPASNAVCEAVYNIYDGVILLREFERPVLLEARSEADFQPWKRLPRFKHIHEMLWMGWQKLHVPFDDPYDNHKLYTGSPALESLHNNLGSNLTLSVDHGRGLTQPAIRSMMSWLNWIVVNDKFHNHDLQIIDRCLRSRNHPRGHVPYYGMRETFQVGHWAFYALIGLEISVQIVKFLAFHKGGGTEDPSMALGHKFVNSITVFRPWHDPEADLTDEEKKLYVDYPVLLFQVKPCTDADKASKEKTEELWGHPAAGSVKGYFPLNYRKI